MIRDRHYRIVFGVVTRKDPAHRSLNLPLFSRISLMRSLKTLQLMDVPAAVMFVTDDTVTASGRKKKRKKKVGASTGEDVTAEAAE